MQHRFSLWKLQHDHVRNCAHSFVILMCILFSHPWPGNVQVFSYHHHLLRQRRIQRRNFIKGPGSSASEKPSPSLPKLQRSCVKRNDEVLRRLSFGKEKMQYGVDGQGRIKYFSSWSSWISVFFIDIAPKGSKNYGQQTARSLTLSSKWVGRG